MGNFVRSVRGYVSMGIGLVACPCHLPLTLPLLLSLTAGTAFSAWLATHTALVYGLSTLIFIGGFGLGMFWLNSGSQRWPGSKLGTSQPRSGQTSQPTPKEL
jgi:mercuric ion transport protein